MNPLQGDFVEQSMLMMGFLPVTELCRQIVSVIYSKQPNLFFYPEMLSKVTPVIDKELSAFLVQ